MSAALRWLLLVVWVGSALFTGAVAVPLAFAFFPAAEAGAYTAALFRAVGWIALPAALLYLWLCPPGSRRTRAWPAGLSLLLLAAAVFGGGAAMDSIRAAEGAGSVPGWLHGLASAGFVAATALAGVLVWLDARPGGGAP